jgi:DNA polymerase-3 subunit gamma/tau
VIPVQKPVNSPTSYSQITPPNLDKPTGKYVGSHPSIIELLKNEKENTSSVIDENQPREMFTEDQLKIAWKQYSLYLKEQGLGTFYNALIKRSPIKKGDELYILQLDSDIQKDYITDHMDEFLYFLRKQLRNYYITISLEVVIQHEEEKFLTSKQKFDIMARKNPNLHIFKNRFNLDLEY